MMEAIDVHDDGQFSDSETDAFLESPERRGDTVSTSRNRLLTSHVRGFVDFLRDRRKECGEVMTSLIVTIKGSGEGQVIDHPFSASPSSCLAKPRIELRFDRDLKPEEILDIVLSREARYNRVNRLSHPNR
tara:strand:- start:979 stop:1371 length:393 start_codon:yes stop_codon:yes gene_type:complete